MKKFLTIFLFLFIMPSLAFSYDMSKDLQIVGYYDKPSANTGFTFSVNLVQQSFYGALGREAVDVTDFGTQRKHLFSWNMEGGAARTMKVRFVSSALTSITSSSVLPYNMEIVLKDFRLGQNSLYSMQYKANRTRFSYQHVTQTNWWNGNPVTWYWFHDIIAANGSGTLASNSPSVSARFANSNTSSFEIWFNLRVSGRNANETSTNLSSSDNWIRRSGDGYITLDDATNIDPGNYSTTIVIVLESGT